MPRQSRQLADSQIYHVMVRGVNRDVIFLEDEDFERFLFALARAKQTSGCSVLAYCLMPNHVHLILVTGAEPLGLVMKRLGVSYAGWFNNKYGRVGHLFQDRYKSLPVERDDNFAALLRYVWANPVSAGLVAEAEDYRWSSRRLLGQRSTLVDHDVLNKLAPEEAIEHATLIPSGTTVMRPPSSRFSDDEVWALIQRLCQGAFEGDFSTLPLSQQRRAVVELRMRSINYAQIARVTGLNTGRVRRLHIDGTTTSS